MRIAFLCKRRYMGKDVIAERYARLYEIPFQLARLGHDVCGFCLSYQGHEAGEWVHDTDSGPGRLVWESRSLGRLYVPALVGYPLHLRHRLREFAPDIVIGASDIPHVALGAWLAKRMNRPYVADLYDNFESFGQARIPGLVGALRRATRSAGLVTTTSEPLSELVRAGYQARGEVIAMPSTVDTAVFRPRDQAACRRRLGLPAEGVLVGTAGNLRKDKGVDALYAAWPAVAAAHPSAQLVLAGPHDHDFPPLRHARVHYLGMLPHARTAELFCALDVGVIYLRDTAFGRYCFPQKAYEMLACELPLVAAAVGVMPALLADTPAALYRAEDAHDLARAITAQLADRHRPNIAIEDWAALIRYLEPRLKALCARTV
ncbi:MAG: glycosyltransferase family 4 protein [Nitrococcus mobilis]|nr:glycosyltransferase family 4 protein [Nitrococcus mobilis]